MDLPPADREPFRVEVLEQCLGELARGAELVAQLRECDLVAVLPREGDHARPDVLEHLGVVIERPRDPDRAAGRPKGGEVGRIELGIQRGFEAGIAQALFERQRANRKRLRLRTPRAGRSRWASSG